MSKLSDKRLADWLEQVADGLESGMDAGNAVAFAKSLPETSLPLERELRDGKGWGDVFAQELLALAASEQVLLTASEKAGRLPEAMRKVAEARRENIAVRRRVKLALAYPIFLIHFAALVFSITYLVSGDIASFLVSAGMVVVPVWLILLFVWGLTRFWPETVTALLRRIPVLSSYRMHREASVLCDVLASCLAAGMNVEESWSAAASASGNPKHLKLAERVVDAVRQGGRASVAMRDELSSLPNGFVELYRSGEVSGKLDTNLESAAKRFRGEASRRLTLASLLYPKIILLAIFGYVGYKVILLVKDYFDRLSEIAM